MYLEKSTIDSILETIDTLQVKQNEVVLILLSELDLPDMDLLIQQLNDKKVAFFGGVFPGLIIGNQMFSTGCILKKFKAIVMPFCLSGIGQVQVSDFPDYKTPEEFRNGTALVLLDGLAPNIYAFLGKLNELLGGECGFIGGGAGFMSLQPQKCVFCEEGFKQNAAVVCIIEKKVNLGIRHGWEHFAGPMVATQVEDNTIKQLNWRNAIDVYNEIVSVDCGTTLNQDNFGKIAQGYPFGILRENEDDIVRDPIALNGDGSIECIGEVPPNTVLHVLKGRPAALLEATKQAMRDCGSSESQPINASETLIVDCITRALFLENQFIEEMNIIRNSLQISSPDQEPYGVLSLGEISSYGDGMLELFNKTIVVGTFN